MAATSSTLLSTTSRKQTWDFATGQEVLNLATYRYLQTTDASKPEGVNGFVYYLEHVRKVVMVDVQPGSLVITVECGSLQKLKELWHDYCEGFVSAVVQKFLLTKDIVNELGLSEVKFSTSVPSKKYRDCHDQLQAFDSGQCNYLKQLQSVPSNSNFFFSHLPSGNSNSHYLELLFDSPESSK